MLRTVVPVALLCLSSSLAGQTIGLTQYDPAYAEGYLLFAPMGNTTTYLIDRCGNEVNQWTSSYGPGLLAQLHPDGSLLRAADTQDMRYAAGGRGGAMERYDWSGNLTWSYDISNDSLCQHHDFTVLPNGNILLFAWDRRDSAEAVQQGKDPAATNAEIWSERILELEPVGSDSAVVVWEWKLWDHLIQDRASGLPGFGVVADHPELMDINFVQGPPASSDWLHFNSIAYNADLDQVMVIAHSLDELWIIDHSTTTAEAAGHTGGNSGRGGDLLYRWGNPRSYDRGVFADRRLFGPHNATWLPAGHPYAGSILLFNNGVGRPGPDFSSVDILTPPLDVNGTYSIQPGAPYGPATHDWTWTMPTPTDLFAAIISGVHPVADGYLVTDGPRGRSFQLDALGAIRTTYINPVNQNGPMTQGATPQGNTVFRYEYYPADFDGFDGVVLAAGDPIELNPIITPLCLTSGMEDEERPNTLLFPNPAFDQVTIVLEEGSVASCTLVDTAGREQGRQVARTGGVTFRTATLAPGLYTVLALDAEGRTMTVKRFVKGLP